MARRDDMLAALLASQAGGFLAQPPGLDGSPGLGIAGISGAPRGRTWDAFVSAHAPDVTGETVTFTALDDGTLVVEQDVPDDSLAPIADAIEEMIPPPYRAAAARAEGGVWTAVADAVQIVSLPGVGADELELTVVAGERALTAGDGEAPAALPALDALDALAAEHDDVAIRAERVDGDIFAVDVFPL